MERLNVRVKVLEHGQGLDLPAYMTAGSAGMDLRAAVREPVVIESGHWELIPTGICIELCHGYDGQVRPRSGLAVKHGLTVLNAPGTIDSDYRGEIKVALINHGRDSFTIEPGMRIAQLVVSRVVQVQLQTDDDLSATARNEGGFGHTDTV